MYVVLHSFPPDEQVQTHSVTLGESVLLQCRVPHSVPVPTVTWMRIESMNDPKPRPVELSERIIKTEDGRWHHYLTILPSNAKHPDGKWKLKPLAYSPTIVRLLSQ